MPTPEENADARQKRAEDILALRLHQAPLPHARSKPLRGRHGQRQRIDMRGDAPDDTVALIGEKQLRLGVREPAILFGRDVGQGLAPQRRHPVGIIAIEPIGERDERLAIARGGDEMNGQVAQVASLLLDCKCGRSSSRHHAASAGCFAKGVRLMHVQRHSWKGLPGFFRNMRVAAVVNRRQGVTAARFSTAAAADDDLRGRSCPARHVTWMTVARLSRETREAPD